MTHVVDLSSRLPKGTRLNGVYEIESLIAAGGMGEVYKGFEIETGEPVALKFIRPEMARDDAFLALFRREAAALARLHHEVIVKYFLFSQEPDLRRLYLAMEFVEGEHLGDLTQRGALPVEKVHTLQKRLALGLQAAHDRGIVHRDVSPDNVIVLDGAVEKARIIDFGIARSDLLVGETVIGGGFAGKYSYVSPEQLGMFGGEVTARSDIYSLGLVLAQCLLGKPLDMGRKEVEVIERRRSVPDLSRIDSRFVPLLERMLQPDPADRPNSMTKVAQWPLGGDERTLVSFPSAPVQAPARAVAPPPRAPDEKRAGAARMKLFGAVALAGASAAAAALWVLRPADHSAPSPAGRPSPQIQSAAPPVPDRPEPEPFRKVQQIIQSFDGGSCFLAVPHEAGARDIEIDGFGRQAPFEALDAEIQRVTKINPRIEVREAPQEFCPALDLARKFASFGGPPLTLSVKARKLSSGDQLAGDIETTAPSVLLFILDEEGVVHDVTAQLRDAAQAKSFAMKLALKSNRHLLRMLLVAIASAEAVGGLEASNGPAARVFASLGARLAALTKPPAIAVEFVSLENNDGK
ncbi:serine/threonine-protein kinase [Methylocystis heyeri]|uniref:Protein kinase n=1 Tax=Methylocystis heyeri TaxID=391905 RepID=A0A6B8KJL7_9HYPH|nr:serine/threonine-protein kinase [Methylocystis heyeri]QGM47261.1 protein kinase [Methylocystis heyeri]